MLQSTVPGVPAAVTVMTFDAVAVVASSLAVKLYVVVLAGVSVHTLVVQLDTDQAYVVGVKLEQLAVNVTDEPVTTLLDAAWIVQDAVGGALGLQALPKQPDVTLRLAMLMSPFAVTVALSFVVPVIVLVPSLTVTVPAKAIFISMNRATPTSFDMNFIILS